MITSNIITIDGNTNNKGLHDMNNTRQYKALRAWLIISGSDSSYIRQQVELARSTNAPANATYQTGDTWQTIDNIKSIETLKLLANKLNSMMDL
jgi:hypothetical protein